MQASGEINMSQAALESLENWLSTYQSSGFDKLKSKISKQDSIDKKSFFYLFGISNRWFEATTIQPEFCHFWQTNNKFGILNKWNWPSLARLYIIFLVANQKSKQDYITLLESLFNAADVQESILLIESLAFIPFSEAFVVKAQEAARSNIPPLFSAVAHHSDYAFKHFNDLAWNQLVLKAAFLELPVFNIHGLKARNNKQLVKMLRDFITERKIAARSVAWDLWLCIAWLVNDAESFQYLQDEFYAGDIKTQAAIALALTENSNQQASELGTQLLQTPSLSGLKKPVEWQSILNCHE